MRPMTPQQAVRAVQITTRFHLTHGAPPASNAHQHSTAQVANGHKGIFENFKELRDELRAEGREFQSETDSEVVAHLISRRIEAGDTPEDAMRDVLPRLRGAFALVFLFHGEERLLIASHIVPWREDHHNRLNPQNGLCLSALHDRAFDQGLITVTPEYLVVVSPALKRKSADSFLADALLSYDQSKIKLPERFKPSPDFLQWHGQHFGY